METTLLILVVEDDFLIKETVKAALEEAGFVVAQASSAKDAMARLDAKGDPAIRALVTDINLGQSELSGWDVARHAREIHSELPVVYMTGESADDWSSKGVPNSVLIPKPFVSVQVVTAISQLLNAGTKLGG